MNEVNFLDFYTPLRKDDFNGQACDEYQPIQTLKWFSLDDMEAAEDTGCDTCVHHNQGKCQIYLREF